MADVNDPRLVQSHDYYTFSQDSLAETDRTRAFVKIQDGCNYFCTYCIIPFLRGRVRSRNSDEILQEVITLEQKGYKEIVLSGINIGTYLQGENFHLTSLLKLLQENTSNTRFRLSSIEPNLITDEMIDLMRTNTRLCNYFHIPLQHGSNKILKLMNRKYNLNDFTKVITKIRRAIPDIAIGTDAIVGFPSEDEEDFRIMYDYIKTMGFAYLHIFRYSKRDGTKAALMSNQVPDKDKKVRSAKLRKLGENLQKNYIKKFLDKELEVLFETSSGGNSENFIYVKVNSDKDLTNEMKRVKITKVFKSEAEGVIIE